MASVIVSPPYAAVAITAANAHFLQPSNSGVVNRWAIGLLSASFSGSVTIKGRTLGSTDTPVAFPYISQYLNGAVGTGGLVSTAITGTSYIEVDASEFEIVVDCTAYTSGTLTMTVRPVLG